METLTKTGWPSSDSILLTFYYATMRASIHAFYYKKLVSKKGVLGRSKNQRTIVLCSRNIKKLCNINLYEKEYIDLLPLVNLYDFCLEKTVPCYFDLLGHFS